MGKYMCRVLLMILRLRLVLVLRSMVIRLGVSMYSVDVLYFGGMDILNILLKFFLRCSFVLL